MISSASAFVSRAVVVAAVCAMCMLTCHVPAVTCQQKCMQKMTQSEIDGSYPKGNYDFIAAYNITATKNGQSCGEFLDYFFGYNNENATYVYKIGDTTYKRTGRFVSDENQNYMLIFDDSPNEKIYTFFAKVGSIIVVNQCNRDQEWTVVYFEKGKDLSKEAADVAKGLTSASNLDDYKLDPNGCL